MTILPPAPILWAILLSAALPVALRVLSRRPFKIAAPGRRFVVAWAVLVLIWTSVALTEFRGQALLADYAAGLMIFGAAVPVSFMLWSVLCWGVTLNMLVYLAAARQPISRAEWERGYAGTDGLTSLVSDRAGLLFRLGLATSDAEKRSMRLTATGLLGARLASFLASVLSVKL